MDELDLRLRELAHREAEPLPPECGALLDRLEREIRRGEERRPHRRLGRRTLLLAAAAAVLLSVSALAASGVFSAILDQFRSRDLTAEQETAILESTAFLGKSQTTGGVTVTVEEAYGDGNDFYLYLEVEAPEDLPFTGFENMWLSVAELEQGGGMCSWKAMPQANHFMMIAQHWGALQTEDTTLSCELHLENLINWPDPLLERETVVSGEWTIAFTLDCNTFTQQMEGLDLLVEGETGLGYREPATAQVVSITLRPLGAQVTYWAEDPTVTAITLPELTVVLEDGSEVVLDESAGHVVYDPEQGYLGENVIDYQAQTPVLLDQVRSIRIGELELPWQPEM